MMLRRLPYQSRNAFSTDVQPHVILLYIGVSSEASWIQLTGLRGYVALGLAPIVQPSCNVISLTKNISTTSSQLWGL